MILRRAIYGQKEVVAPIVGDYQRMNLNSGGTANNDRINLGNTVGNNIRTIAFFWTPTVTHNSSSSTTEIMVRFNSYSIGEFYIYASSNGKINFTLRNSSYINTPSNSTSWTAGTEYHLAFIIDPSTGVRMEVDGVVQASTNARVTTTLTNSVDLFIGGGARVGVWDNNQAKFRNLQFWNTARTSVQIATDKTIYYPSGTTDLKETFHFANETGATTNGEDGTVGTITTSNAGGVTYINSTVREIIPTVLVPGDGTTLWTNVTTGMVTGVGSIEWSASAPLQWGNTGSFASLPANTDGYLEWDSKYSAGYSSGGYFIIGLSNSASGTAYTDVTYNFYFEGPSSNRISSLYSGARQNASTGYTVGSTMKIERISGVVKLYIDGVLFYTHPVTSTAELFYNTRVNRYMGAENLKIEY